MVSIVSVNYNQPKVTIEFLESVARTTSSDQVEVILIDNGSDHDYEESFKKSYPNLIYIRSKKNLGFAGGNNLGIKISTGNYLLFLNNDTELTENMISILVKELVDNPEIGLVSPLIMYHDDRNIIQYAGYSKMNYITARNKGVGARERDSNQYYLSRETGFVHGAAMMCRKKDIEIVGYMSENYFLYYEEIDWCEKFKKAGKKIWFTGKTRIYHKESMSVGKESSIKTYFMHRNRFLYIRKNADPIKSVIFCFYYILIASPISIIRLYRKKRSDLIPYVIRAIIWNLTNSKTSKYLGYKIV